MMTLATLIIFDRYWYDALSLVLLVALFLVEMFLLFRNTLLGWAMTAKCLVLAAAFSYALVTPPYILPPENVTAVAVAVRVLLDIVLGCVIFILLWMRVHRLTVVVGREGRD